MYDLEQFTLSNMTACGSALRRMSRDAASMEEVAGRMVRYFYETFTSSRTGERSFVLVRFFKTHPYELLDPSLRSAAREMLDGKAPRAGTRCLTLLATVGDRPEWNSRVRSANHKAIPLTSGQFGARFPMISQLIKQLGFGIGVLFRTDPELLVDLEQSTYNVFHVPRARSSPHVPHQEDFVLPLGIQSVLGFGGMLPCGNLFATIVFSRNAIRRETANMFKPLALSAKIALLPFAGGAIFS